MMMMMNWMTKMRFTSLGLVAVYALVISGCGGSDATPSGSDTEDVTVTDVDLSHGGWWCVEHGVPEEECALCDKSLVSKFKEDDDWCDEHERPESQCFICSPSRFDKYVAKYEAKTGNKPPQPEE